MKVSITPSAKPIRMVFTGNHVRLPDEGRVAIDSFWEEQIQSGRNYRRGEVFSVNSYFDAGSHLEITTDISDYAHYIYTVNHDLSPWSCRVVHTSVLIESSDNFLIFGQMADHTSSPRRLQCAGGGIGLADLKGNTFDIESNALAELQEETGIVLPLGTEMPFSRSYVKTGGQHDFVGAIFVVTLTYTAGTIAKIFDDHNKALIESGEAPEFSSLVCVEKSKQAVEAFIRLHSGEMVDYLPTLLRTEIPL